ncbi:DNA-binding response regulator [Virgibacillus pantothenticus]|uniref:Histidine kinase n=1 Tax=Virgibacillus pantothenticus TaxID=1473 RepID=A0A0L0QUN0_VIRPA|nr:MULTISPECIES: LytTR family DNA-binding domain-containing protein [Virgibacillus]API91143.1 DNA-binding response regulator [Virgibacillus sp. 6R]KNE21903.1 histidine kinase [Virgibacillus pantothenticus]MBS7429132.1 response regulator transcription factor [Virgibacillus sp. 19R1-5]MBU8566840.1 LytTR family DNA-binding domain-containing protein [Virgibacillus pantothenticus]MBU8600467.1 LytTR family DNA-binding domain-containing protein [Virgibacillus pantothenticus]
MSIQILIAEDEHMARKELLYLLKHEENVHICPAAETGEQLVEHFFTYEPDVIFLDVHMPGLSGVEAAKKIFYASEGYIPLIVFTTAYDDYALDAFEIEAVDYLLKPYDVKRFKTAMKRVRKRLAQIEDQKVDWDKPKEVQPNPSSQKLLLDDGERMVVVDPDSIYYAVPFKRMLEIHTTDKTIHCRMTLQELEDMLTGFAFFRTHRSYLVNLNYIDEITPWFNGTSNITLKNKQQTMIPVSRSARKALLTIFSSNHS